MTTLTLSHPALALGAPASLRSLWAGSRVLHVLASLVRALLLVIAVRPSSVERTPARPAASTRPATSRREAAGVDASVMRELPRFGGRGHVPSPLRPCHLVLF